MKFLNKYFAAGKPVSNEPRNANLISIFIAFFFIAIGSIEFVAEIISMFFMLTYGAICLISLLEHFAADPSYRPTFRSRWYISFIGTILSFWLMFKMNAPYAIICLIIMGIIYYTISVNKKEAKGFGKLFRGVVFQLSRQLQIIAQRADKAQSNEEHRAGTASTIAAWLPVATVIVALSFVLWLGILPIARSARELDLARRAGSQLLPVPIKSQVANHHFERAAQLDPLDPMPHVEHATWLVIASGVPGLRDEAIGMAADALEAAIQRDPHSIQLRRMKTQLHQRAAQQLGREADYLAAIRSADPQRPPEKNLAA